MTDAPASTLASLEFKVESDWANFRAQNPWAAFIQETATDAQGNRFMRRAGGSVIYREINGKEYECTTCETAIEAASVAHPIHDGPFPFSGSGQVHQEAVPYCPRCERKPDFHGRPIDVPFPGVRDKYR